MTDAHKLTVGVKKSSLADHEAEQEAWEVTLEGTEGDVTFAAWTDETIARASARALAEVLQIALGEEAVRLDA